MYKYYFFLLSFITAATSYAQQAENKQTLALNKQETYVKKGLGLTDQQADAFFDLQRNRTRQADSLDAAQAVAVPQTKQSQLQADKARKAMDDAFIIKLHAVLNPDQVTLYFLLEEAKRAEIEKLLKVKAFRKTATVNQ